MNDSKDTSKIGFFEMLHILWRALKTSLKIKTPLSLIISFLGFGVAFIPAFVSYILKLFTNEIHTMSSGGSYDIKHVLWLFFFMIILHVIQVVFNFLRGYTLICDSISTRKYLIKKTIDCSCSIKYKYIENYDNYTQRISFLNSYAGVRVANSVQLIISLLSEIITFVSITYMLCSVNIWIVLIMLITSIPAAVLSYMQKDESYKHNVKWMTEGALFIHYYMIMAKSNPTNEVRHYRLYDHLKACWKSMAESYLEKKNALTAKHVKYNSVADILRNIVYIAVLILTVGEIYKNPAIGLGTFTLVMSLSKQFQSITSILLIKAAQIYSDTNYMKDFFEFDNLERENIDRDAVPYENCNISFENVDFTYPESEHKILKNVSVNIKKGEKIAIVGENGSGKTTFVNLLCGMYSPDSGKIKIDDTDIFGNITATRRTISAIFQDFGKYDTTIKQNITVSNPEKESSDEEIMAIAERVGIAEYIKTQPNGLDEEIGAFSLKGNNLSGGQWQKVALARALYRDNANIMILDEPTAALDPIAETDLYRRFADLTADKTTILISHRLGITSLVDRILVFHDGEIVEDGSHKELLSKHGYYYKMYSAQAQWYV